MSVDYQLHSKNDLREWNAFFRKGATSLKIDPHYMNTSDTLTLSHDAPILGRYPYSTLDDVLSYFQKAPRIIHDRAIDIALCFKSAPKELCADESSEDVINWNKMVDSFFARASDVVEQVKADFNITLKFVLDGDGKPCDCKADRWMPWNSVWIVKDECSLQCFNSDEGFCRRFSILNDPDTSDWAGISAEDVHYGKFGLVRDVPLQLWEPDAQDVISGFVEGYMTGRTKGIPSGGGLAFAINVDIAMFDTFTSRILKGAEARGFNVLVEDGDTSGSLRAANPSLVYQSANEITLQYWMGSSAVQRKLTMTPFTSLDVGPPQDIDEALSFAGLYDSPRNEYHENIREFLRDFGAVSVGSSSHQEIGEYSFIFFAAGGKVYAGSKHSDELAFTNFRLIGLGSSVHATSLDNVLLLVTEGNHCYNSHGHNTRAFPLVCDPKTEPGDACEYALDYSLGTARNWFSWLQETNTVITPCNEHILHGTFSGGHNPSGILIHLPSQSPEGLKVGVMVAHEPYPLNNQSICGTPKLGETGIVLSAFASFVVTENFVGVDDGGSDINVGKLLKVLIGILLGLVGCWLTYIFRRRRLHQDRAAQVGFTELPKVDLDNDRSMLLRDL
uniref:Uncharacterized protein n=1 Tax=Pyramimonas obovata TaxID=1411642 RepID=A0A7S0MXQ1_9CHLO|mmetsp:Transcript_15940/g.34565  ORF Transcript_15940/g.34565 Transcript_15940/m.34565 type:complete len:616 (+) Transcript_15940:120-1967(+)